MHELGLATGVCDSVVKVAKENNCKKIIKINLVFGSSSAIVKEALVAAFDALKELDEYRLCADAQIFLEEKESTSICLDCGHQYTHGYGAAQCPKCRSFKTQIIDGTDIYIKDIEVEN